MTDPILTASNPDTGRIHAWDEYRGKPRCMKQTPRWHLLWEPKNLSVGTIGHNTSIQAWFCRKCWQLLEKEGRL